MPQSTTVSNTSQIDDIFIRDDGKLAYIVDNDNDDIKELSLDAPWSFINITVNHTFDFSGTTSSMSGVFVGDSGDTMYVTDTGNSDVYELDMSTSWDLSTVSYNSNKTSISSNAPFPEAIHFKDDGSKFFTVAEGSFGGPWFVEYTLSTNWDITSTSFSHQTAEIDTFSPFGLTVNSEGSDLITQSDFGAVARYELSTDWDLSTLNSTTPTEINSDVTGTVSSPAGIYFLNSQTSSSDPKYYVTGSSTIGTFGPGSIGDRNSSGIGLQTSAGIGKTL